MTEWPNADSNAALAEGWDIFTTSDHEHAPYELCKLDDPMSLPELGYDEPKFTDDAEVWLFVRQLAEAGSLLHQRALAFIAEHAPTEYEEIMSYEVTTP